jgi:succinate dehydrogenase / fumarate reductase flavoprotein subunit
MARDALDRDESCGGHFREEHQDEEGECVRNDDQYMHVSVWEHQAGAAPVRHQEPLSFEYVKPAKRSYK